MPEQPPSGNGQVLADSQKYVVYVIDDAAICREGTADILRREGYVVHAFSDGPVALKALAQDSNVHLILLDLVMPEMDGFTVLKTLKRNAAWAKIPVLILTGSQLKQDIVHAAQLGAKGFLLKSKFCVESLLKRVGELTGRFPPPAPPPAAAAAADAPKEKQVKLLSRAETRNRVEKFVLERSLAGSVADVIALTSAPHADMTDLIGVIRKDVVLATRILQLANSAAYTAAPGKINTIEDAVRNVGFKAIRNIAVSVGIFDKFPPQTEDGFNFLHCWRHSFAVASIMDWMTPSSSAVPSLGYVIGLCHDLGELVIHQCLREEYDWALKEAECNGETFDNVKAAVFGVMPQELSALVVGKLNLPATVQNPILEFFKSARGGGPAPSGLARSLRLADSLANGMMLANNHHAALAPIPCDECRDTLGTPNPVMLESGSIRHAVVAHTSLLARLPKDEEARVSGRMFPPTTLRIGYVRESHFSTFDPLLAAVELLGASVEVLNAIPESVGVADKWDAMVVACRTESAGFGISEIGRFRKTDPRTLPILYVSETAASPLLSELPRLTAIRLPVTMKSLADAFAKTAALLEKHESAAAKAAAA